MDWPTTLPLPLLRASRFTTGSRSWRTEMETGRIRQRRVLLSAFAVMDATWHFTQDKFEEFKNFFEVSLENGSLPFEMDIGAGDLPEVVEVAFMAPYQFSRSDNLFAVSAVLQYPPAPVQVTMVVNIEQVVAGVMYVGYNSDLLVTVTNGDQGTATAVILVVTLPVSFTFISATAVYSQVDNVLTFDIGDMDPEEVASITITVRPTIEQFFTSTAVVTTETETLEGSDLEDSVDHEVFDGTLCEILPTMYQATLLGTISTNGFYLVPVIADASPTITFQYQNGTGVSAALIISVVGNAILITGRRSGGSNVTAASEIVAAINGDAQAAALVIAYLSTATGSSLWTVNSGPTDIPSSAYMLASGNTFECYDVGDYSDGDFP